MSLRSLKNVSTMSIRFFALMESLPQRRHRGGLSIKMFRDAPGRWLGKKCKVQNVFALSDAAPKFLSRFTVQLRKCALPATPMCMVAGTHSIYTRRAKRAWIFKNFPTNLQLNFFFLLRIRLRNLLNLHR